MPPRGTRHSQEDARGSAGIDLRQVRLTYVAACKDAGPIACFGRDEHLAREGANLGDVTTECVDDAAHIVLAGVGPQAEAEASACLGR